MIVTLDGSCRYEAVKRYLCLGRQYSVSDFTVSLAGYDIYKQINWRVLGANHSYRRRVDWPVGRTVNSVTWRGDC